MRFYYFNINLQALHDRMRFFLEVLVYEFYLDKYVLITTSRFTMVSSVDHMYFDALLDMGPL